MLMTVAILAAAWFRAQHDAAHRHVIDRAGVTHHATAQLDHHEAGSHVHRGAAAEDVDVCWMPPAVGAAPSAPPRFVAAFTLAHVAPHPLAAQLVITRSIYRTSPKTSPPRDLSSLS